MLAARSATERDSDAETDSEDCGMSLEYEDRDSVPPSAPPDVQAACRAWLRLSRMDAPEGPTCACGQPSAIECGLCATCASRDLRAEVVTRMAGMNLEQLQEVARVARAHGAIL